MEPVRRGKVLATWPCVQVILGGSCRNNEESDESECYGLSLPRHFRRAHREVEFGPNTELRDFQPEPDIHAYG